MKIAPKFNSIINKFFAPVAKSLKPLASAAVTSLLNNLDPKQQTLAKYSNRKIKTASHEQNIRRMLSGEILDFKTFAPQVLQQFKLLENIELVIDRTNWKYGKKSINFFVLAVVFENTALPLHWIMLDNNGGNSTSTNRIDLIKWFVETFPTISIKQVYADREFPSNQFLAELMEKNINFIFRSKNSVNASNGNKKISLAKLYNKLQNMPDKTKIEAKIRRIYGCRLFLHARLNDNNEQVFLVSNMRHLDAFTLYRRRWTIENMFGKFKTKGFNLEATKMTDLQRLSNLFLLMSIAYVINVKIGAIASAINPSKLKKIQENNKTRMTSEFSLFNFGSKLLKNFFANYLSSKVVMKQLEKILNYAPNANISKRLAIYNIMANI